jgi:8-oxo-dGTP pyrophosphatase MutT (NUDIX family)
MQVIYAQEDFPKVIEKTLFLAGPSPRSEEHPNWRIKALEILGQKGYDGVVFTPLLRNGKFFKGYKAQIDWEQAAMNRSDVILFWVPRDLRTLPGFTTNVEFGQKVRNCNVVLGYPPQAPRTSFLGYLAERNFIDYAETLDGTVDLALQKIGQGAKRVGGECEVPLYLWNLPHFQSWIQAQKHVGNRLDGCIVELAFGVRSQKAFILYWVAHVNVYVASESRNKSNEIVISRPDIKHVVAYYRPEHAGILDTEIVLIREFRTTATTPDGFIHEIPGGSNFEPVEPEVAAAEEFFEETGIEVVPERLVSLGARQLAGTTSSHKAHAFKLEMTAEEMTRLTSHQDQAFGNTSETELTYVEVYTVRQLLNESITDWCNLGMIFTALNQQ